MEILEDFFLTLKRSEQNATEIFHFLTIIGFQIGKHYAETITAYRIRLFIPDHFQIMDVIEPIRDHIELRTNHIL